MRAHFTQFLQEEAAEYAGCEHSPCHSPNVRGNYVHHGLRFRGLWSGRTGLALVHIHACSSGFCDDLLRTRRGPLTVVPYIKEGGGCAVQRSLSTYSTAARLSSGVVRGVRREMAGVR
jgi:hypothetical protein